MKTPLIRTIVCTVWAGASVIAGPGAWAQEGISASVEPRQFSADDTARLTVTLSGSSVTEPVVPHVEGLEFHSAGQSTQMQSINGIISRSESHTYVVVAQKAGTYELPPIEAHIDGTVCRSKPISLHVTKRSGLSSALQMPSPPRSQGNATRSQAHNGNEVNSLAFLRIQPGKTEPYLGELVPVQLKAYFRESLQARLNGLPQLDGTAFTLHKLSNEPQRSREVVGNQVYSVLTWYTGMSATKPGDYPVSAQLDATLLVPERSRSRGRSMFGGSPMDSFFDDELFASFFGRVQEQPVTLTSEARSIRVRPLPADGRPAEFDGAVGSFELSATAKPVNLMLGDPVTVRVSVKGYGNFDRVSHPHLSDNSGFKTYDPTHEFEPKDTVGYEGVKTFEQVIIPKDGSATEIPAITFTYFDPNAEQYVTVGTDPVPLQIAAAGDATAHSDPNPDIPSRVAVASSDSTSTDLSELGPALHVELGRLLRDPKPMLFRPWFIGMQALPLAFIGLGLYLHRRNTLRLENPSQLRRRQANHAVDDAVASMKSAIRASDVPAFFSSCRRAVQERLGELWGLQPLAITLADIRRRLPDAIELQRAFETADAVAYSGETYTQDQLRSFQTTLQHELESLGGRK